MKSDTENLLDQAYENVGNLVKNGNFSFSISAQIYSSNFPDFTSSKEKNLSDHIPFHFKVEKSIVQLYDRLVKAFNDFKNHWTQIHIPIFKVKNFELELKILDLNR